MFAYHAVRQSVPEVIELLKKGDQVDGLWRVNGRGYRWPLETIVNADGTVDLQPVAEGGPAGLTLLALPKLRIERSLVARS